jgi:hypothetical protein
MIYYHTDKGIYTQRKGLMSRLITKGIDDPKLKEIFTEVKEMKFTVDF